MNIQIFWRSSREFIATVTDLILYFTFQSILTVGAFEVDEPWTLAEETMLLDAVEQYGFGNW